MSRYILAFNGDHVCLRKTLCVHHRADVFEVRYDAKPIKLTQRRRDRLIKILKQFKLEKAGE